MLGCIQPMSSPMMKRMLGFGCADADVPANPMAVNIASRTSKTFLVYLIVCLLIGAVLKHVGERAGRVASLGQPVATASNSTSSNFAAVRRSPDDLRQAGLGVDPCADCRRRVAPGTIRKTTRGAPENS